MSICLEYISHNRTLKTHDYFSMHLIIQTKMPTGKGITNSKLCIRKIDHKYAYQHNLATLQENAKTLLRNKEFLRDKRSIFLFLILEFVPNYIWISHRSDVR